MRYVPFALRSARNAARVSLAAYYHHLRHPSLTADECWLAMEEMEDLEFMVAKLKAGEALSPTPAPVFEDPAKRVAKPLTQAQKDARNAKRRAKAAEAKATREASATALIASIGKGRGAAAAKRITH